MLEKINEILDFWFNPSNSKKWWSTDPSFDEEITARFEPLIAKAVKGNLSLWTAQPLSCLAYIILLDQFSRNAYRGTPQAYQQDSLALEACKTGIDHKLDRDLNLMQRHFFYMPLMHSEDLNDQKMCVALMTQLIHAARDTNPDLLKPMEQALDAAYQHYEEIYHFGRFPRRNSILKRSNAQAEEIFLNTNSQNRIENQRVRWACRRGMLELDLFLIPFFENGFDNLNSDEKGLFKAMLLETDPTLYAWLMAFEPVSKKEFESLVVKIRSFRKSYQS